MKLTALLLISFLAAPAFAADEEPSDFQKNAAKFMVKCGKCHTVGRGDRVGPDLKGVTERRERDWLIGFISKPSSYLDTDPEAIKLLKKFNDVRMEDLGLSLTEIEGFLEYIEAAGKGPIGPREPEALEPEDPYGKLSTPDEGLLTSTPGLVFLVLLLILAAAAWQLNARRTSAIVLAIAALTAYWSFGGRRHHRLIGNQQGYSPVQPIDFSHQQHAGNLKIACLYCHHGAEKSDVAGVPSVNICMNCHTAVKKIADANKPSAEIEKLAAIWAAGDKTPSDPLEWVRVHNLPDYVHFSHQVHVRNNIKCQECHGPVQEMKRLRQASDLSMGWCVNCHRKRNDSSSSHWKRTSGSIDCTTCHW